MTTIRQTPVPSRAPTATAPDHAGKAATTATTQTTTATTATTQTTTKPAADGFDGRIAGLTGRVVATTAQTLGLDLPILKGLDPRQLVDGKVELALRLAAA